MRPVASSDERSRKAHIPTNGYARRSASGYDGTIDRRSHGAPVRDFRDTLLAVMLFVVLSLGATAVVYEYVLPRYAPQSRGQSHPTDIAPSKPYAGPVPTGDYDVRATFFGDVDAAPFGFELLNSVPISVRNGVASAKATGPIDESVGTNRRTGKRTYAFSGSVDPKTKRLVGTVTLTVKAREGSGSGGVADYDYRYTGTLSAPFTSADSIKGAVEVTEQSEKRYLGPNNMPIEKNSRRVTWEFSGTRR
jgi:hypothetical protein